MTQHTNNGLEAKLEDLQRRIYTLESGRITKWFLTVLLSGIVLPVVLLLINHLLFDRPAESSQFEARYDLRFDDASTNSPAYYHYTLTIKNTGWQREIHYLGNAKVSFPSPITEIDPISAPPGTTYGSMKSKDANVCIGNQECDIGWGGLVPRGDFIIDFAIKSPPDQSTLFPSVRYGGCPIKRWSCSGLPNIPQAFCKPSAQSQLGIRGTRLFRQQDSRC